MIGGGKKGAKMGKVSSDPSRPGRRSRAREFSDKREHSVRNYAATSAKKSAPPLIFSGKPASRSPERYLPFFIRPLGDARVMLRDAFRAAVSYALGPRLYGGVRAIEISLR